MAACLLGGSFDPPHLGHLHMARAALEHLPVDTVSLLPSGRPPHKSGELHSSASSRLAMVRLLAEEDPRLSVDDRELRRDGLTYTLDTLKEIRSELGADHELVFLIGSDSLRQLGTWYRAAELVELARFVSIAREDAGEDDDARLAETLATQFPSERVRQLLADRLPVVPFPVSSTEIRKQIAGGDIPSEWITDRVARYIRQHQLYR
jgi:nicotinate-nucleotide adenylyltransferase